MSPSKATVYRVAYRFHVLIARQRLEQGVPVKQVVDDFMRSLLDLLEFCEAPDEELSVVTTAPGGSASTCSVRCRRGG